MIVCKKKFEIQTYVKPHKKSCKGNIKYHEKLLITNKTGLQIWKTISTGKEIDVSLK